MRLTISLLLTQSQINDSVAKSGQALYELDSAQNFPLATPEAIVNVDGARFTVLTDHLIRAEQMSDLSTSSFEDRPTMSVLNRALAVPDFTSSMSDDGTTLTISTPAVTLTYTIASAFGEDTLKVTSNDEDSVFSNWHYGQQIPKDFQLPGTIRTLDQQGVDSLYCDETPEPPQGESFHCTMALFSRAGYAVYDDSTSPVFGDDGFWAGQNEDDVDLYLYFHGLDFKLALKEYSMIGGKMPIVPRYALGPWFTRWTAYNQYELDEVLKEYELRSIPLDVLVLDMNWHKKDKWTGYSFDDKLFPYDGETLVEMKEKLGLKMALNIHDADGVFPFESKYQAMADAVGFDTSNSDPIPFMSCSNSTYAYALEDEVMLPLEENSGVDFFWIDWQQGGTQGGCTGERENPTIWTNKLRVTDKKRRGGEKENERGMVLARWGGLGNHRYQVGFSGDVNDVKWETLAYQPYFSSTSANVGFSLWSHDLVGAQDDDELFLRWLQWGAFSGIFRNHDRGMSTGGCADEGGCNSLLLWDLPEEFFQYARDSVRRRSSLMPYIYSSVKKTHEDLTAMLRPMYHDYAGHDEAFGACSIDGEMSQYMFGDSMFVAPIVKKADETTLMSEKKVWIPPGDWIDHLGMTITGPQTIDFTSALDETPVYVQKDSVIPTVSLGSGKETFGSAMKTFDDLTFTIYPTSFNDSSGKSIVYEDDGITTDYFTDPDNASKTLTFQFAFDMTDDGVDLNCSFDGMEGRKVRVVVENCPLPSTDTDTDGGFEYDAQTASCSFELDDSGSGSLHFTGKVKPENFSGWRGAIKRSNQAKIVLDAAQITPGSMTGGQDDAASLLTLASLGAQLHHAVKEGQEDQVSKIVEGLQDMITQAKNELADLVDQNQDTEHQNRVKKAQALMEI